MVESRPAGQDSTRNRQAIGDTEVLESAARQHLRQGGHLADVSVARVGREGGPRHQLAHSEHARGEADDRHPLREESYMISH